ncbi:hypothetical protein EBZ02_09805, partial [bacterium]|nr:hypothetical protein [bacterium]
SGGTSGSVASSSVVDNGSLVVNRSNALTIASTISGTGSLTQQGSGTTTLTGANTYTGGTTLNAGTLSLGSANALGSSGTISFGGGTLQATASNTSDYSSRFSTAAGQLYNIDTNEQSLTWASALTSTGGSLTKSGAGGLTLTANNTYSGGTVVNAGTLSSGGANFTTTLFGSGSVTINSGAQVILDRSTLSNDFILNGGTLHGSNGFGEVFNGNITVNSASTLYAYANDTFNGAISGSGKLTLTGGSFHNHVFSGNNSAFTGGIDLNHGLLTLNSANAIGSSGTISFGGGTLQATASNTSDYSSRFSTAAGQLYSLDTNGQNLTWATALSSSGGSLTKTGAGTLTLTGDNTFTGTTTISAGTLQLGSGGTSGSVASSSVVDNGSLVVNRSNALTIASTI